MRFDGKSNKQRAKAFKLTELSGVTTPAHTGADVTIFKVGAEDKAAALALRRKEWRAANPGKPDTDMPEELQKFADLFKSAFDDTFQAALAAENVRLQMKPVWDTIWANECALREAIEDAVKDGKSVQPVLNDYVISLAQSLLTNEDPAMSAELQKQLDEANAQNAVLTAEAGMNDAQKAYYGTLDETAKASFRALDNSTRDVMVSTAKAGDEIVKVNGAEIRKSAVGDATFQILKSQQEEITTQKEASTVAKFTEMAKSADFATLPGELTVKAAALREIDELPEVAKAAVTAMLKAGNEAMKARHAPAGAHVDLDGLSAQDKLDSLAKAYAAKNDTTFEQASVKVMETPDGAELYKLISEGK
ncbi:MAG: hypothetical protein [Siphoviridae sp. ctdc_1]|nr:MAG: hypothetical protein [Siphoviridae sp. ctdc_1]